MAVDIYTWITTFNNQGHLAHQACILVSAGLLVTGIGSFVYSGYEGTNFRDFDGDRRRTMLTWATGALGMVATAANTFVYGRIAQLDRFDPLATEESMSIRRTTSGVVGAIILTVIAVAEYALAGAASRNGFHFIPGLATLAGCMTIVAVAYDIMYLFRRKSISLDDAVNVPLEHDEFDP